MRFALTLLAFAAICAAQDWAAQVLALRPAGAAPGENAMLDEVQARAQRTLDAVPRAHTGAQADRARAGLRHQLEASLGFRRLPWPPSLHAHSTGAVQGAGYHIEKLVYETLPGV